MYHLDTYVGYEYFDSWKQEFERLKNEYKTLTHFNFGSLDEHQNEEYVGGTYSHHNDTGGYSENATYVFNKDSTIVAVESECEHHGYNYSIFIWCYTEEEKDKYLSLPK